jgi:hypothetical protein
VEAIKEQQQQIHDQQTIQKAQQKQFEELEKMVKMLMKNRNVFFNKRTHG